MEIPTWTIPIIVMAVVGTVAVILAFAVKRHLETEATWYPVGPYNMKWQGAATPEVVQRRLLDAINALHDHTVWSEHTIATALHGWRISVRPDLKWIDVQGRQVAGLTHITAGTVEVGADLAALCHELAHVVELFFEHAIDYTHSTWVADGIRDAEAVYAAKSYRE